MIKMHKHSSNFEFFINNDWSKYAGKWVAICDNKVISKNEKLDLVLKEAKIRCKKHTPTFTKIPDKDSSLLL